MMIWNTFELFVLKVVEISYDYLAKTREVFLALLITMKQQKALCNILLS